MIMPHNSRLSQKASISNGRDPSSPDAAPCDGHATAEASPPGGYSRRHFLQGLGAAGAAAGALTLTVARVQGAGQRVPADTPFPRGAAVRVKPILVYDVPTRQAQTSWRNYGGIHTLEAAREEAGLRTVLPWSGDRQLVFPAPERCAGCAWI